MTGFPVALRLAGRRSRAFYAWWIVLLAVLMPATVTKYHDLVPPGSNAEDLMLSLAGNPTMRAILGPAFDLSTPGGFTFWRVGTFTAAAAAMMAALGVIRATRAEEEEGRLELLRAGAMSRLSPLAAGLALSFGACLATGVAIAALMAAATQPVAGAVASGLGIALTGAMFAALAGVVAQVFPSARTARVWTLGIFLGGLYLLRALVDGSRSTPDVWTWLMPLDWAALARPYAHERWWVLILPLAVTVALTAVALRLESTRDHGDGLVSASAGPATAPAWLRGAPGLAWRLLRTGIIGWTVGILISAVSMGSLSVSLVSTLDSQPAVADMLRRMGSGAAQIQTAFFVAMLLIMASVVTISGVLMLSRLAAEEQQGRTEVMLATSTTRWTYALSFLVPALVVPMILLVATGAGLPVLQAVHDGSGVLLGTLTKGALVLLPGVALVMGVGMLTIGWAPRWFGVTWAVLGWSMFASWLLPLFTVPDWLIRLQPWGHLPHLPVDPLDWTPIVDTSALALAFIVAGLVGFRRRNIQGR